MAHKLLKIFQDKFDKASLVVSEPEILNMVLEFIDDIFTGQPQGYMMLDNYISNRIKEMSRGKDDDTVKIIKISDYLKVS